MVLYALLSPLLQCVLALTCSRVFTCSLPPLSLNSKDKEYQSLPFVSSLQGNPPSHTGSASKITALLPSPYRTDSTLMNTQAVTHHRKVILQVLLPNGQSPEQDSCILLLTWQ